MTPAPLEGAFEPLFLDGAAGPVFAIYHPARAAGDAPAVLYLPPFAEEMNRARRVAALQARALAAAGAAALILDPYGCGDSAGAFSDARWDIWQGDAARAVAWLRQRGHRRIMLLGLRLGALLALATARALPEPPARVILWQPVLRGEQMVTQFLRLKLAAELARDGAATTTTALRQRLAAGEIVEIAGYPLGVGLTAGLDQLALEPLGRDCPAPIDWIETAAAPDQAPAPAQQQVAARWAAAGVRFAQRRAVAEPFWSLQETTLAPDLVALTTDLAAANA